MKLPLFTAAPEVQDASAWKERRVVSREEVTSARQARDWFDSREDLLRHGEQFEARKFILGKYLADYLRSIPVKSVLSLGCGECYHEYAIKLATPGVRITATDFDPFVVERVRALLPEIDDCQVLDIKKDDFAKFHGKFDTVLMLSVEYVLSDDELVDFFRRVSIVGVSHLIMMSVCYLGTSLIVRRIFLAPLTPLSHLKRLLLGKKAPQTRFHGWARSRGEFARLTKAAGTFKLHKVITGEPFTESQALFHFVLVDEKA